VRWQLSSKPKPYPENTDVDATDINVKAGAHYLGRSAALTERTIEAEKLRDGAAEVSRGHSKRISTALKG